MQASCWLCFSLRATRPSPTQGLSPQAAGHVGRQRAGKWAGRQAAGHLKTVAGQGWVSLQRTRRSLISSLLSLDGTTKGTGNGVDSHGVKEARPGCPLCCTASQGHSGDHTHCLGAEEQAEASLEASEARVHLGPSSAPLLPPLMLCPALFLSSDLDMAGEPRPGPTQPGQKRQPGTAISR